MPSILNIFLTNINAFFFSITVFLLKKQKKKHLLYFNFQKRNNKTNYLLVFCQELISENMDYLYNLKKISNVFQHIS